MSKGFKSSDEVVNNFLAKFIQRDKKKVTPETGLDAVENVKTGIWRSYFIVIMKYKFTIVALCALFFVCCCTYFYTSNLESSTVRISLNYEEASQGLNPNGTPFDIYNIISDEVLQKAIDYAGYTDTISTDELADAIYISETTATGSSEYYICTSYRVTFDASAVKNLDEIGPKNMLSLITKAYKDYFFENYTTNHEVLNIDFGDFGKLEYDEIQRKFSDYASRIDRFVQMRVDEGRNFTASNGATFKSLKKQVTNLVDYSISDLESFIWEKGVLKDADTYVKTMEYRNYIDNQNYQKFKIGYTERKSGIDLYNSVMTASVLVPTYDTSGDFYMSRTKNGVDYLADEAAVQEESAKEISLIINTNRDKIAKAKSATVNKGNIAKAEDMIKKIEDKLTAIVTEIRQTDLEYKTYKTKDYLTINPTTIPTRDAMNFTSGIELTLLFALALIFVLRKCEKIRKAKK